MNATGLSFVAPHRVEWVTVELPPLLEGHVLVRTLHSGISPGSELLAYRGRLDPKLPVDEAIGALGGTFEYPFRFGYSCVGTVETGGELPPGTQVFAFVPHQTAFVVPADDIVVLDGIDSRSATLYPLVETALQISLEVEAMDAGPIVILGLGPVGLLTGAMLARRGIPVVAGEPLAWRREIAPEFGIEPWDPAGLEERTRPDGVPIVIDTSGNPAALSASLELLGHEGTVLVASWYGNQPVQLNLGGRFHRRRLTIKSTQVSTIPSSLAAEWTIDRRRTETARLMAELPLERLATHTWPYLAAADAYKALDEREHGLLHAALVYD
jgi:2-desacetyl-2-hydroxyethyl bacteriochlorophyllide A dehydrogenase